jgi:hypothetical protein
MLKKFISIFLSKFPDRFAYLVIIICIIVLGSFAYETVGLPIQTASAEGPLTGNSAASAAIGWVYMQKCFGDRIKPDTVSVTTGAAGNGAYHVNVDFVSLEYRVDLGTGELHHIPVNHTVAMFVSQGKVISAAEGLRDLINAQVYGPVTDVSREYL